MDAFANKPGIDKQAYYEFTADKKGLPKNIIEKDFWVCWTLKQLFNQFIVLFIFKYNQNKNKIICFIVLSILK